MKIGSWEISPLELDLMLSDEFRLLIWLYEIGASTEIVAKADRKIALKTSVLNFCLLFVFEVLNLDVKFNNAA
jgi:hypothetical protein